MTTFRMTSADQPFVCSKCGADVRLHNEARAWQCPTPQVIEAARVLLTNNGGASEQAVAVAYAELTDPRAGGELPNDCPHGYGAFQEQADGSARCTLCGALIYAAVSR